MKWRSAFALLLTVGLAIPHTAPAQDTRPGIGVLPFENGGSIGVDKEDLGAFSIGLQQMLITELAFNGQLRLVDRTNLKQLMEEQDLGKTGRVDAQTAAKIGKIVGAKYMILGGFIDWNADLRIDARVVDVETTEIIKVQRARDKRDNMNDIVVDLANNLTKGLNLPALSRQAFNKRKGRKIPPKAVKLYTKGLFYQNNGNNQKAAELFSQASAIFPEYTEAQKALKQVKG
ncbi:MAG: CsgG/HfaB family protein [Gemmatimonadales bacterium]